MKHSDITLGIWKVTVVVRWHQIPFNICQQWICGTFVILDLSHRLCKAYLFSLHSIRLREMEGGGNHKENTKGHENERTWREEMEKLCGERKKNKPKKLTVSFFSLRLWQRSDKTNEMTWEMVGGYKKRCEVGDRAVCNCYHQSLLLSWGNESLSEAAGASGGTGGRGERWGAMEDSGRGIESVEVWDR